MPKPIDGESAAPCARDEAKSAQPDRGGRHPAAEWALGAAFTRVEVDCTTAVVLKILDNKCKMLPGEKRAIQAVYDAVKHLPADLFGEAVHKVIHQARNRPSVEVAAEVHRLRVEAEARIPKTVMKAYKARLREGLFG